MMGRARVITGKSASRPVSEASLVIVARPSKYSTEQILDAVLQVLRGRRPDEVSIAAVGHALGAPSGSIYHRFESRDALVASAWLRAGESFVVELARALQTVDPFEGARAAARYQLEWARRRPTEARLFLLHDRSELTKAGWPVDLARRAERLANETTDTLRRFAARVPDATFARVRFALLDLPQAAIRRAASTGAALDAEAEVVVEEALSALLAPLQPVTRMAS